MAVADAADEHDLDVAGLDGQARDLLALLDEDGESHITEMRDHIGATRAKARTRIEKLEERGFIETEHRQPDEGGQARTHAVLTDRAAEAIDDGLLDEILDVNVSVRQLRARIEGLETQLQERPDKHEFQRIARETVDRRIETIQDAVGEARRELSDAIETVEEHGNALEENRDRLGNVEERLEELEDDLPDRVDSLEDETDELAEAQQAAAAERRENGEKVEHTFQVARSNTRAISRVEQTAGRNANKILKCSHDIDRLEGHLSDFNDDLTAVEKTTQRLTERSEEYGERLEDVRKTAESAERTADTAYKRQQEEGEDSGGLFF